MKRLLTSWILIVLVAGLALPVVAESPAAETAPSLEEQFKLGQITEKEFDAAGGLLGGRVAPDAAWPGPDGYGYVGQSVDYSWVDITTTGTLVTGWTSPDDGYAGPFPIGFSFSFYATGWDQFYAGTNGFLSFGSGSTTLTNQCPLPSSSTPNDIIPILWDDLNLNVSGNAYYQTFGTCPHGGGGGGACLVVEYYDMGHYGGTAGSAGTWEAILYDNGNVVLQFLDSGTETGSGSTTGVEDNNAAADWGLTYACNVADSIPDGLAVLVGMPVGPYLGESTKAAPAAVEGGDPIEYTITIVNTGNASANDATLVDPIPAGTTYVPDSVACSSGECWYDSGAVYWAGEVAIGALVTVTFSAVAGAGCGDVVVNEAVIDDPEAMGPVTVQASTEVWEVVLLQEAFEGQVFPPAGWIEVHDPAGAAWTDQDLEPRGNLSGGSGKFAIVDDDYPGSAALTNAELWTPPFDVPAGGNQTQVRLNSDYYHLGGSYADVDISVDGGATWSNLSHWTASRRGPRMESVDLSAFAGATGAIVRFHYADGGSFAWWWEVDNVQIVSCYVGAPEIDISPTELSATLCPDQAETQQLTICNLGDAPLDWRLAEVPAPRGVSVPRFAGQTPDDPNPLSLERAPAQAAAVATPPGILGQEAFVMDLFDDNMYQFPDIDVPGSWNLVGGTVASGYAGDFAGTDYSKLYVIANDAQQLWTVDTSTGVPSLVGPCVPNPSGQTWTGMAWDHTTGTMFATGTDGYQATLYTLNLASGAAAVVANIASAPYTIDIAVNSAGQMYGHEIAMDSLLTIDKVTGATSVIGPTGFNANYAQGMEFDDSSGTLYLAAYNGSTSTGELRIADTNTGATTLVGTFPGGAEVDALGIIGIVPDIPWLSESPLEGTVPGGECQVVDVTFDSAGLGPGTYAGALSLTSNDLDEPQIDVPVTLTVESCGENELHLYRTKIFQHPSAPWWVKVVSQLQVTDENGVPVEGVTVTGDWTLPDGTAVPGVPYWPLTDLLGRNKFQLKDSQTGVYTFCVTDLSAPGYAPWPAGGYPGDPDPCMAINIAP